MQGNVVAQGWLGCLGSVLGALSIAALCSGACATTLGTTCIGCALGGASAVMFVVDQCN